MQTRKKIAVMNQTSTYMNNSEGTDGHAFTHIAAPKNTPVWEGCRTGCWGVNGRSMSQGVALQGHATIKGKQTHDNLASLVSGHVGYS